MRAWRPLVLVAALALAAVVAQPSTLRAQRPGRQAQAPAASSQPQVDPASYAQLKYRYIGPEGNRVTSVAGVTGDPKVYYAGAASGGMFKTTDGGIHWQSVFDDQPVSSVGSVAVAPSDPNVVWAGTGEPFIRSHISVGWGMYKSTDAGKSWAKSGLDDTGRISRIVIHPTSADVVYACALGHAYGPQQDRGVFRTTDGGRTWDKVLFVDENTGCSDLVMDPSNPRNLFAGFWQIEIHAWGRESGGPGSGIYRSTDGGATWKPVEGNGLPAKPYGKVGLAMSKADSSRVYALVEVGDGVPWHGKETQVGRLWRSDDGGAKWAMVTADRQVAGRTHYYNRMGVTPDNPDEAYFLTASWAKTLDGGKTIIGPPIVEVPAGDHHDIWFDQANGNRMIVSHDVGVSITENRGRSWLRVQLPIAQMYHVTVDTRIPYFVYGNRQDGPSTRGPSNSKLGASEEFPFPAISRGMWSSVGGGESGWATPDPEDPNIVWSSASGYGSGGGIVVKYDVRTNVARYAEVWPQAPFGSPAADLKYRFVWTFPLTISPHDHNKVYVGSQYVHVTTDGGVNWQIISPDLTRNDKSRQQISGGLTPDNIGVEYSGVVFAIAESRLKAGLIWAGTNDGQVQLTQDGGKVWTNLTTNIPNMLPWGTVSNIEPSRYDAGTAYLTVDGHQVNNRDPWIYKTTDYGKTWKLIVSGISKSPLSYAHCVREDPVKRGLLYAGTENGLYVSFNDGESWQPLQNNLPHAPVYWMVVQEHFNDLVVATYGRGFWILDDLTPLRQLTPELAGKDAELLAPRAAYRFRNVEAPFFSFEDPVAGNNPPDGAAINYWLKTAGKEKEEVSFSIEDAAGKTVRTFKGPMNAGLNRVWWDLTYDKTKEARLRTNPLYASYVKVGPEGMPAPSVGRFAVLAPPGTYTVKLKAGDKEFSQPLTVRKDPGAGGSEKEIGEQMELARDLAADIDGTVEMINGIESARGQLAALKSRLGDDAATKEVREACDALDKKFLAIEENLFQVRITGRGQDNLRWPQKLAEQLVYLAGQVTSGDFAPTTPQREVHQLLHDQAKSYRQQFDQLVATDLAAFNTMLGQKSLAGVVAKP